MGKSVKNETKTATATKPEIDTATKNAIKRFIKSHPSVESVTIKGFEFTLKELGGKVQKEKDPNAPPKPLSSYILFCNDKRKKSTVSLTATQLGEMWKNASDKDKKPFSDAYAKAKIEYDAKVGKASETKTKEKAEVEESDASEEEAEEAEEKEESEASEEEEEEEEEEEKPAPKPAAKGKAAAKPAPKPVAKPAPKEIPKVKGKPAKRA